MSNDVPFATQYRKPGVCFSCGKAGHWKNERLQAQTNLKISFQNYVSLVNGQTKLEDSSVNLGKSPVSTCTDFSFSPEVNTGFENKGLVVLDTEGNVENQGQFSNKPIVTSPVGRLKKCLPRWKQVSNN